MYEEKRQDPYSNDGSFYTYQEFVSYYGPEGRNLWSKARPADRPRTKYYVGQKVRALTKLQGDNDQFVNKGDIGHVTALPGRNSAVTDPTAVAEVLISRVRFDAHDDMIEPVMDRPRRDYNEQRVGDRGGYGEGRPYNDRAPQGRMDVRGPKGGRTFEEERRRDPNDPKSRKTYTRREFKQHYGDKAAAMWKKAADSSKPEKRADPFEKSNKTYERSEFIALYGPKKGALAWDKAGASGPEKRSDPNEADSRKKFTRDEFIQHYGASKGASLWNQAERRTDPNEKGKKTYTKKEFLDLYGKEEGSKLWTQAAPKGDRAPAKDTKPVEDKKVTHTIDKGADEKIGWSREDTHILEVEPESPAAKAGVRPNYRIVFVNGEKATDKNLSALIKKAGDNIDVQVVQLRQDASDPKKRYFSFSEFCQYYKTEGPSMWKAAGKKTDRKERKKGDKDAKEGDAKEETKEKTGEQESKEPVKEETKTEEKAKEEEKVKKSA